MSLRLAQQLLSGFIGLPCGEQGKLGLSSIIASRNSTCKRNVMPSLKGLELTEDPSVLGQHLGKGLDTENPLGGIPSGRALMCPTIPERSGRSQCSQTLSDLLRWSSCYRLSRPPGWSPAASCCHRMPDTPHPNGQLLNPSKRSFRSPTPAAAPCL